MKNRIEIEKIADIYCIEKSNIGESHDFISYIDGYTECQEEMFFEIINNNKEWSKQCAELEKELEDNKDKKYTEEDMISFAYQFSSINVDNFRKHLKDFDINLKEKNKKD